MKRMKKIKKSTVPRVTEEVTLPLCEWSSEGSGGKPHSSPSISSLKHKGQSSKMSSKGDGQKTLKQMSAQYFFSAILKMCFVE